MPILRIPCYNGSLVTWTVVRLPRSASCLQDNSSVRTTQKTLPFYWWKGMFIRRCIAKVRRGTHRKPPFFYCCLRVCCGRYLATHVPSRDLSTAFVFKITPWHGPRRKHCLSIGEEACLSHRCIAKVWRGIHRKPRSSIVACVYVAGVAYQRMFLLVIFAKSKLCYDRRLFGQLVLE
jgi:hypothetical protein